MSLTKPATHSAAPAPTGERIREYWNARADATSKPAATTHDVYLRRLEVRTLTKALAACGPSDGQRVLDIGCGDGHSTRLIAAAHPTLSFTGVDYSESMIRNATSAGTIRPGLTFIRGDVLELSDALGGAMFDFAMSDRCLINLPSDELHARAIEQIARCLVPNGRYLMVENFMEGHDGMNGARAAVGLPAIEVRWHNHYFTEQTLASAIEPWFDLIELNDFAGAYMYATRVVYSKLCAMRGEEPDYEHDIHRLAVDLPSVGYYAATRLAVLRRTGKALA